MQSSRPNDLGDCLVTLAQLVACEANVGQIQHLLRVARSKLGAAIDQLEQCELPPEQLERVHYSAAGVASEIASLLATVECKCS